MRFTHITYRKKEAKSVSTTDHRTHMCILHNAHMIDAFSTLSWQVKRDLRLKTEREKLKSVHNNCMTFSCADLICNWGIAAEFAWNKQKRSAIKVIVRRLDWEEWNLLHVGSRNKCDIKQPTFNSFKNDQNWMNDGKEAVSLVTKHQAIKSDEILKYKMSRNNRTGAIRLINL